MKTRIEYAWLLATVGIATFLKLFSTGEQIRNGIHLTNTLDFSWQVDNVERLLHGFLAGRVQ